MNLQGFVRDIVEVANDIVIPFLLGIAFLIFVINVFRFFIVGGSNQDSQEKARALATYSILAIVFIIIFWGVVNLFSGSLGLNQSGAPTSDYLGS